MTNIINERGVFWWGPAEVPAGHIAPPESVSGTLSIDADGRIDIELDGILSVSGHIFSIFENDNIDEIATISGFLKSKNMYILAQDIYRNGATFNSRGISFEKFGANNCLVSSKIIQHGTTVERLIIDITDFSEWLGSKAISTSQNQGDVSAKFLPRQINQYHVSGDTIIIKHNDRLDKGSKFFTSSVTIFRQYTLEYSYNDSFDTRHIQKQFSRINDLILLLTGSENNLPSPMVQLSDGNICQCYFVNSSSINVPLKSINVLAPFSSLSDNFGQIMRNWISGFDDVGPGYYLYTSTRRISQMYMENRFSTLVNGLEALHRYRFPVSENQTVKERIGRIIASITDQKDKKWFEKKSARLADPILEERLFCLLQKINIRCDRKELRRFCKECAEQRNNIAHEGKIKTGPNMNYDKFSAMTESLAILYHALLLIEIGVRPNVVDHWIHRSPSSHNIGWYLERSGIEIPDDDPSAASS